MSVLLTEKAAKEVKKVMDEQGLKSGEDLLRVAVTGGGCSGFSYGMSFTKKEEVDSLNDHQYEVHGVEYVVDNRSAPLLKDVTVDFHDGINKRGFTFDNPNSIHSCGCGMSFNV